MNWKSVRTPLLLIAGILASPCTFAALETPAQMQGEFNSIMNQDSTTNGISPWSLQSYFDRLLLAIRATSGATQDAYFAQLINNAYDLTSKTGAATNTVDKFTTGANGSNSTPYVVMNGYYTCGFKAAYLVHHAVSWGSVVAGVRNYLEKVGNNPSSVLRPKIDTILAVSMNGLNYFDRYKLKFNNLDTYVEPYYPANDCTEAVNQNAYANLAGPANYAGAAGFMALELMKIFELPDDTLNAIHPNWVSGKTSYFNRQRYNVEIAFNTLLPYQTVTADNRLVWNYMPSGTTPEDTNHGALVVKFLVSAWSRNKLPNASAVLAPATDAMMDRLVNTFLETFSTGPSQAYNLIDAYPGRTQGSVSYVIGLSRWIPLAQRNCQVYRKAADILNYKDALGNKPYWSLETDYAIMRYAPFCY